MKVELENVKPMEIERRSFEIITQELGRELPEELAPIIKRCIHTSADFEYADSLCFSDHVVEKAMKAIKAGACIVTDTQMAKSGINKKALGKHGGEVFCFMSDEDVAETAKKNGTTRATASMDKAAALDKPLIFAIGNAPTALVRLYELIVEKRIRPGAHHRCSSRFCQCGAVQGADHADRCALYCGKGAKRRKQYCGVHLQCPSLHVRAAGVKKIFVFVETVKKMCYNSFAIV